MTRRTPWWLFPRWQPDRATDAVITQRVWWWVVFWAYLAGPTFRALMGLGTWDVREGDYYTNGRARWDVWRAGRPWGA